MSSSGWWHGNLTTQKQVCIDYRSRKYIRYGWYGTKHAKFQNRRVILAIPLGGSSEHYAQHTIGMFRNIIDYLGMKYAATTVAPGVYQRGVITEKHGILKTAHQAGIEVVETIAFTDYDAVLQGPTLNTSSESTLTDSE